MEEFERLLDRQIHSISQADAKSSTVLTVVTAMLGTLMAVASGALFDSTLFVVAVSVLATLFLVYSILALAICAFPRVRSAEFESIYYFGDIPDRSVTSYLQIVQSRSAEDKQFDLASQIHRNASIAKAKYSWLSRAMISLFLSLIPWALSLYMLVRK